MARAKYLTIKQYAAEHGLSPVTVYHWAYRDRIAHRRRGDGAIVLSANAVPPADARIRKRPSKGVPAKRLEIVRLYKAGGSVESLAKKFKLGEATIKSYLRLAKAYTPTPKFSFSEDAAIRAAVRKVADELGHTPELIASRVAALDALGRL